MTGGTVIMDLVVARIGEGGGRVDVTNQAGHFAGHVTGSDVINTVIDIRNLRRMTGRAGHTGAGGDGLINGQLRRSAVAVVSVEVTAGTVGVLSDDISEGYQVAATVIVTDCTTLLGALRGVGGRVVADIMHMGMAVEVIRGVTLATITRCCRSRVGGGVVTNGTGVVLLVISGIDEVRVINRLSMAIGTFGLQGHLGGVILTDVGAEVTGHTCVTLATVTGRLNRGIGDRVVTGGAAVVLGVVQRIDEVQVIDGGAVTAGAAGCLGHLGGVILGCVGAEVTGHTCVTLATVTGRLNRQLGIVGMADVTVVVLEVIGQVDKSDIVKGAAVTAGTPGRLGHLQGVIFGVGGPIAGHGCVTLATVIHGNGKRTVGGMTGGTGVMLLVVDRINKTRSGGHGHRVTAGTFAVQRQVAGGLMIDIMIGPVATNVTVCTGVRSKPLTP